jgi:hypothetical protein
LFQLSLDKGSQVDIPAELAQRTTFSDRAGQAATASSDTRTIVRTRLMAIFPAWFAR